LLPNQTQLSGGIEDNAEQLMSVQNPNQQQSAQYRQMLSQINPGASNFSYAANGQYQPQMSTGNQSQHPQYGMPQQIFDAG
jgi:hypothetical protein